MGTQLSSKYGQKPPDSPKTWTTDAIAILKTTEATGDLIIDKIADKITSVSKKLIKNQKHQKKDTYFQ